MHSHSQAHIGFVGDVMLGELLENYGRGVLSRISKRHIDPFQFCHTELEKTDYNVANLECVVSDSSVRSGLFRDILRAPASFVALLRKAPIHMVNLANNHALDHGRAALRECVHVLEQEGISVIGVESDALRQASPVLRRVSGVSCAFWGFNIANCVGQSLRQRFEFILDRVQTHKGIADRTIVALHWGEEYTPVPPPALYELGRTLIQNGCDLIHGHHSHRLQGTANVSGGVFSPSLGNFIFDDRRHRARLTAILRVTMQPTGAIRWTTSPYYINRHYQPVPAPQLAPSVARLNACLGRMIADCDSGRQTRWDARVQRTVQCGHLWNRVRMRALMLVNAASYRGSYTDLLRYPRSPNARFSVSDDSEWIANTVSQRA